MGVLDFFFLIFFKLMKDGQKHMAVVKQDKETCALA